jgi:LPS-assembly lipoprotein
VLFISGCGFHLRGMMDAPNWMREIAISSNSGDLDLVSQLKSQLNSYKIRVVPYHFHAPYWLIINQSTYQQRIISVGASTNPRQYQLILTVEFTLQSRDGKILIPQRQVVVTRQLTINNDRILGSNAEERILMNEMRQDLLMQMLKIIFITTPNTYAN